LLFSRIEIDGNSEAQYGGPEAGLSAQRQGCPRGRLTSVAMQPSPNARYRNM